MGSQPLYWPLQRGQRSQDSFSSPTRVSMSQHSFPGTSSMTINHRKRKSELLQQKFKALLQDIDSSISREETITSSGDVSLSDPTLLWPDSQFGPPSLNSSVSLNSSSLSSNASNNQNSLVISPSEKPSKKMKQLSMSKFVNLKKKLKAQKKKVEYLEKCLQLQGRPSEDHLEQAKATCIIAKHTENLGMVFNAATKAYSNLSQEKKYVPPPETKIGNLTQDNSKILKNKKQCDCLCFCSDNEHSEDTDGTSMSTSTSDKSIPSPNQFLLHDIPGLSEPAQSVELLNSFSPTNESSSQSTDWESPNNSQTLSQTTSQQF